MSPAAIGLAHGSAFAKKKKGIKHAPAVFGLSTGGPLGMASRAAIGSGLAKRRKRRMSEG